MKIQSNSYHPKYDNEGNLIATGRRNSLYRLNAIKKEVNFKDKTVLDLGCQSGFFSFDLAKTCKKVIAVDADIQHINENRKKASNLGIKNLTFIHAKITPETLDTLPKFDVILCLSVFHHLMISTNLHDFDSSLNQSDWKGVLDRLRIKSNVLIFEMGNSYERKPWAKKLGTITKNSNKWIFDNVFKNEYKKVISIKGANYKKNIIKTAPWIKYLLYRLPYGNKILNSLGLPPHDFRDIHIGFKSTETCI